MNKRILLKISGESLMGSSNYGIDVSTINKISKEIKKIDITKSDLIHDLISFIENVSPRGLCKYER